MSEMCQCETEELEQSNQDTEIVYQLHQVSPTSFWDTEIEVNMLKMYALCDISCN